MGCLAIAFSFIAKNFASQSILPTSDIEGGGARMTEVLNLERLEKETFHQYQSEDGMWDVFMGLLMVFWAMGLLVDSTLVSLLMLVPPAVFIAGKALITVPRLGRVRFNDRRLQRGRTLIAAVVLAVVVSCLLIVAVVQGREGLDRMGDAVFIAMTLVLFSMMAYVLQYWRLVLWGMLLCGGWAVAVYGDRTVGVAAFLLAGAIVVSVGLMLLRNFMQKYPVIRVEE